MIEKITQSEIDKKSVASLPTRPNDRSAYGSGGLSAPELRARFDALALLAISKYNELVGAIGKEGADGLISMMPSGIEGKSLAELLSDIRSGDLAGYLTAYSGEGDLQNLQTIITDVYEKLANAGSGDGTKLVRTEYKGKDADGGNVYEQVFSDDTRAEFTAPKGEDGADGLTPYIKNGNWWIGNTDTGVPASGGSGGGSSGGGGSGGDRTIVIVQGTYVGTGGSDENGYTNSLYVPCYPKFLCITPKEDFGDEMYDCRLIAIGDGEAETTTSVVTKTERGETTAWYAMVSFQSGMIHWQAFDAESQMNAEGKTYVYLVIGDAP